MIMTHCGKVGDMLYALPIASWWWKTKGEKVHWVLPSCFHPFRYIGNLLRAQEATGGVLLVDYRVQNFGCGGQPYRFDPAQYGVTEGRGQRSEARYLNLGLRKHPEKFITAFMAEEHGVGWDEEFVLRLPEDGGEGPRRHGDTERNGKGAEELYEARTEQIQVRMAAPQAKDFKVPMDLLELGLFFKGATVRHCWYSGPAAMCYLARLHFRLYRQPGRHPELGLYFPDRSRYEVVDVGW